MISESSFTEAHDDALLHTLISGWAKSRGGDDVNVVHGPGHTHCVFRSPPGGLSRDRESFYWHDPEIIESARRYHQGKHHYLSILGNDALPDAALAAAGYKLLAREMLMYRPVSAADSPVKVPVKRVHNTEEANWFNQQKGRSFILPGHINDSDVYDFYTCQDGLLTSYARAIHQNNLFVVDDVQTHPDHRRKGLASAMLAEIAGAASRAGASAEILIASQGGIPLYLREQYRAMAPLRVFGLSVNVSD